MIIKGFIHKFGDNIDTDVIIPGRFCNTTDEKQLARGCFHDYKSKFYKNIKPNDVLIAGENFGCGSSREMAPLSIKASGISCIIAKSFSRLFFRNAINIGLHIIENKHVYELTNNLDIIVVNFYERIITLADNRSFSFDTSGQSSTVNDIIKNNGLMEYIINKNFNV